MLSYRIHLEPDDNGTLMATSPDFPEVTTFGDDEKDARAHAVAAIEEALAARIHDSRDIPDGAKNGTRVALPTMTALKVGLYRLMRKQEVNRAELMRRLGWNRESVDRLFRLDHNSRLDQIEAAYAALGQHIAVQIKEATEAMLGDLMRVLMKDLPRPPQKGIWQPKVLKAKSRRVSRRIKRFSNGLRTAAARKHV